MDLNRIIQELLSERARISAIIESLERMHPAHGGKSKAEAKRPVKRRGRKPMNSAERQEVSQRMKEYWEKRRRDAAAQVSV
jgi:ribosomal protein S12 methylthiotransferase accessory factor YcaO